MNRLLLPLLLTATLPLAAADWPCWRGPTGDGKAAPGENPPLRWSATENVLWKSPIPGQGHSSPVIHGSQIYLTAADSARRTQAVLCFNRATGDLLWETVITQGRLPTKIHQKNTHASPTPICDGQRVYALFHAGDVLVLAALDLTGKEIWKIEAGSFLPQYDFGYGASPLLHGDLIIVASEFSRGGYLAAFHRTTGKLAWKSPRNLGTSYSSPIVASIAGRQQLLLSGHGRISSYDPLSGRLFWEAKGCTQATCGTLVWDGDTVFASGGFPTKETIAIKADGSRKALWTNNTKAYEQSLLAHGGHVFALDDNGIAHCWNAATGALQWQERLGGPVSASPILAAGHIFAANERGQTFVFKATPAQFELIATNQLGNDTFATPAICGDRIYLRAGTHTGRERHEFLYALGSPKP